MPPYAHVFNLTDPFVRQFSTRRFAMTLHSVLGYVAFLHIARVWSLAEHMQHVPWQLLNACAKCRLCPVHVAVVGCAQCMCQLQVVPSGSLAVFNEEDAAAVKPDPIEQMQATVSELQQQIKAMAKTQEAMARCILDKQSDKQDKHEGAPSQSNSEATSESQPQSEAAEGSSKSWLPSLPSFSRAT